MLLLVAATIALPCAAATQAQSFVSSWTVSPWSYEGQVAAMQWQYLPYSPWNQSLGTLQEVQVSTTLTGERQLASEALHIATLSLPVGHQAIISFTEKLAFQVGMRPLISPSPTRFRARQNC